MKKFFKYILINLLILVILLFAIEDFIWFKANSDLHKNGILPQIQRLKFHPGIKMFEPDLNFFPNPETRWGRAAEGMEFNKKPAVIFGCSYAYGYKLEPEQTFSYKLARIAGRPVYNRAMTGWGIQHMLWQTRLNQIYEKIKDPEYVIYLYMFDHIRRLYLLTFMDWDLLDDYQYLRYKEKDGKLIEIKNKNPLLRQIKRLYFVNKLHKQLVWKYINNSKNHEKCNDFALKHFVEAKSEMQKHWKNAEYIVFFYNTENRDLQNKLEENGFTVINSSELTDADLNSSAYTVDDMLHPNEAAWDLITPLFAKKGKLI